MKALISIPAGFVAVLAFAPIIWGHTWVGQLRQVASNGSYIGAPGYPRGYTQRILPNGQPNPAFNDFVEENQVPPDGRATGTQILPTDLMCRSDTQSIGNLGPNSPALTASPQDNVALIYEENGHVTLLNASYPNTKPEGSGVIFIYGTKQPENTDTYLAIHRVWNTDGTGGDKRGKLLATRNFDDGQCYQDNESPTALARKAKTGTGSNELNQLFCQSTVQLPEEAGTSGQYALYWVWEWPSLDPHTGAVVKNESYTSCMDINMTPMLTSNVSSFVAEQNPDSAAIQDQLQTAFLVNPTQAPQITGGNPGAPAPTTPASSPQVSLGFATVTVTVTVTGPVVTVTATAAVTIITTTTVLGAAQSAPSSSSAKTPSQSSASEPYSSPAALPQAAKITGSSTTFTVLPIPAQATAVPYKRGSWIPRGRTSS